MNFQNKTVMSVLALALLAAPAASGRHAIQDGHGVQPLFNLSTEATSPFPSDRFTVADSAQNTGRRVHLPTPADCVANASDCTDVTFLNRLDGFHLTPRLSIPFNGEIEVATVTSRSVFLVSLVENPVHRVGINQVVWDRETRTLHVIADEQLAEHTQYALVITTALRGSDSKSIRRSDAYDRFVRGAGQLSDATLNWYRDQVRSGERAAVGAGVSRDDIAVLSVFSTQSASYLAERTVAQVRRGSTSAAVNFNIAPGGSRALFALRDLTSFTWNHHTGTDGTLTPMFQRFTGIQLIPDAVAQIAFGEFDSPDFMVHPGEYIPEIPSRTGVPDQQGVNRLSMIVTLPSGIKPMRGWPVAIYGHGSGRSNKDIFPVSSVMASKGFAVVAITMSGAGFGPLTTGTAHYRDGRQVTFPLRGRSIDQNGDGAIENLEGDLAQAPRLLQRNASNPVQSIADLTQLLRVLRNRVDIDGDGATDLDPGRVYYFGHSRGGNYGMGFFAYNPEIRAAVFAAPQAPMFRTRRLNPAMRPDVGRRLAARTPSLLNSAHGLTTSGGVAVDPPFFNENLPLRNQAPVVNAIPGAMAIQRFVDRSEWISQVGNPMAWAPRLRRNPVPGIPVRPCFVQFVATDTNPTTTTILRAGELQDRTSYFDYGRWWRVNSDAPKDGHAYLLRVEPPLVPVILSAQAQIADFFASDGKVLAMPEQLREYWQVPIRGQLPEELHYIR